ncbi:MAG TPA: GGDEF domain-containing protein [Acidobacteriaceae bacterium]|jgi:diguanylate cyclase (GGDEF)-like protein
MSYLSLPDLIAMSWLAVVLARFQRRRANDLLHLWIFGLVLIVVEGVARMVYQAVDQVSLTHALTHVIALDAYFLAGVAFFQSAGGKLRLLPHSEIYLMICAVPHLIVQTLYGSSLVFAPWYVTVAILGMLASVGTAMYLRRHWAHAVCHLIVWTPILVAASLHNFRMAAYLSLFFVYFATAAAFYLTLPPERSGRTVLVTGFLVWSLCFLSHPWIAEHHMNLQPMAEKIWDLQKFFVVFGLLIVSLEDYSATNEYQALHDTLTGLPNRRLFEDRLDQAIVRTHRSHLRLVLFNMDLNDFKQVNDTLGHDAGDELLREVGRRLLAVTRETDTLARMGGDEFYLLVNDFNLPDESGERVVASRATARELHGRDGIGNMAPLSRVKEQTARMVEQFRRAVEGAPFLLTLGEDTHEVWVQMSLGYVVFPDEALDRNELCRLADQKMYADKKARALPDVVMPVQ